MSDSAGDAKQGALPRMRAGMVRPLIGKLECDCGRRRSIQATAIVQASPNFANRRRPALYRASNYRLEDVWRFPLHTRDARTLDDFRACLWPVTERFFARSWLFRLRAWLGQSLRWRDRPFEEVALSEREALYAIENRTISALIHFGWVDTAEGATVEMAVYTRAVSPMSRIYMALIRPFRHFWIYPRWIGAVVAACRHA
jgi:hypothetical protein